MKWFASHLADRSDIVRGTASEWAPIHAWVPQEIILEPFLFLIKNNNTFTDINTCSFIRLFADDTSFIVIEENPPDCSCHVK